MASLDPTASGASILDLYRTVWIGLRKTIDRYRLSIAVELILVAVWFALRTLIDVESNLYLAWIAAACAVAFVSPTSGLVILVATVPFFEPVSLTRALGPRHLLVAALGVSVAVRIVAGGWRQLPRSPALILGALVGAITAASVVHTYRDFDPAFGTHAAQMWLATIGGAMILLFVGAWVARTGEARPLIVAACACAVAAVLSITELIRPGLISEGSLSWIGFWKDFGARVSGIIPAPNAVAALLVVPATVSLAAIAQFRGRRRLAAAIVALPLVAAAVLTLSRSAFAALYAAGIVLGWRRNRILGLILLGVGIVLTVVGVPLFIQFRAGLLGADAPQGTVELILGADQNRITAWGTAVRMWLAEPLIGHGFLSYKELGNSFGDPLLGSPHNEILRLFAEEGLVGGLVGVAFVASLFRELARRPGWIGAGLLAGAVAYWIAAMFNNPLLFIQVSAVAFVFFGYGLTAPSDEPETDETVPGSDAELVSGPAAP